MELLWCSRNKAEFTRASACLQQNRCTYHCAICAQSHLRSATLEHSLSHLCARRNARDSLATVEWKEQYIFTSPTFFAPLCQRSQHAQVRPHCPDLALVSSLDRHDCSERSSSDGARSARVPACIRPSGQTYHAYLFGVLDLRSHHVPEPGEDYLRRRR